MENREFDLIYEIRMREIELMNKKWKEWKEIKESLLFDGTLNEIKKKNDELKKLIDEIKKNTIKEKMWWIQFHNY